MTQCNFAVAGRKIGGKARLSLFAALICSSISTIANATTHIGTLNVGSQTNVLIAGNDSSSSLPITLNRASGADSEGQFSATFALLGSLPAGVSYHFDPALLNFSASDTSQTSQLIVNSTAETPEGTFQFTVHVENTQSGSDSQEVGGHIIIDSLCPGDDQCPDDNDPCTTDYCDSLNGDICRHSTDDDHDGVLNCSDDCPSTPAGEPVNALGCACSQIDCDDGDPCTTDTCQNGACSHSIDDDNDGVLNCIDACPNTTAGEIVGPDGCACSQILSCADENPCTTDTCVAGVCLHNDDDDHDGISNCIDLCPDTPAGEIVDSDGCSCSQPGTTTDCNHNGIRDLCETDCNHNGIPDDCEIASGTSHDCDLNGIPDECQPDRDGDGVPDVCDNCPIDPNPDQADSDGDGVGDVCRTGLSADSPPSLSPPAAQTIPAGAACDPNQEKLNLLFSAAWQAPVCGPGCATILAMGLCGLIATNTGVRAFRRRNRIEAGDNQGVKN